MRKLICMLLLAAMALLVTSCNESNTRPKMPIRMIQRNGNLLNVCINGYQFFLFRGDNEGSLTQIWERTPNGPQPMQCEPQEKSTMIEVPQPRNTQ